MADFSGTGKFTLGGTEAKVYDIKFNNEGGLETTGQRATVSNCEGLVQISGAYSALVDSNLNQNAAFSVASSVTGDWCRIVGNNFANVGNGFEVMANNCVIKGNVFEENGTAAANTYDSLVLTGNRNTVQTNKFDPSSNTRYGVNVVSGECNQIVGNDLGDPDDYATDALNDGGSNTQLFWPADATYGDNFVDCGTGS